MNLEALREFKLTSMREAMDEPDRQLRRDLERGHGPALDAWLSTRTPEGLGRPVFRAGELRPVSMESRHRNARRRSAARRVWLV